jgi:hypothetical protein
MKFLTHKCPWPDWLFKKKIYKMKYFLLVIFFFIGICVPIIRRAPGSILAVCLESSAKDTATFHI